eukprot:CAMPEP_0116919240 /NCGR_PEP_ID=MMETSP0467-20121206/20260_1 /TAXON_ID=283647 /ORGANISM="Mesodinium pulex, Strain SPMC105" /LENGTH=42 /DNA_ID= /DNA_START= /DNA_END= /DNA_ORIENTATION=
MTGNFEVFVDDRLIHSKKQSLNGGGFLDSEEKIQSFVEQIKN